MGSWLSKIWAATCAYFKVDWVFMKESFFREGLFWLVEAAFVLAALYVASHLFRRRTLLSRPICRVAGHRWRVDRRDQARWSANRRSLGDTLAGSQCVCRRCGTEFDDHPTEDEVRGRTERVRVQQAAAVPEVDDETRDVMQYTDRLINAAFPPGPGEQAWTSRTVTRTTTTTTAKKATRTRKKGRTRFDREVLADEDVSEAEASPQADAAPSTPADTSSPTSPSEPEGSAPS